MVSFIYTTYRNGTLCLHFEVSLCLGLSPLPATVANEGLWGSPTKNTIILAVTVTGQGDNPVTVVFGNFSGWIRKLVFENFSRWIRKLFRVDSETFGLDSETFPGVFGNLCSETFPVGFGNLPGWIWKLCRLDSETFPVVFRNLYSETFPGGFGNFSGWIRKLARLDSETFPVGFGNFYSETFPGGYRPTPPHPTPALDLV